LAVLELPLIQSLSILAATGLAGLALVSLSIVFLFLAACCTEQLDAAVTRR
jgi:hypothetical protein